VHWAQKIPAFFIPRHDSQEKNIWFTIRESPVKHSYTKHEDVLTRGQDFYEETWQIPGTAEV